MNPRERLFLMIVMGMAGLMIASLLAYRLYLQPAEELNRRIDSLREQVAKDEEEVRREKTLRARIKELAARTYDADSARASDAARARLTFLLQASGFGTQGLSLQPVESINNVALYKDVGWQVRARGPINAVVNFLYLAQRDPRVVRLENVSLSPIARSDLVDMRLRYGTLVFMAEKDGKPPAADVVPVPLPAATLDDPYRGAYQLIVERNLFRPYVPKGFVYVPSGTGDGQPAPIPVEAAQYKVVGLPKGNGEPTIMVQDSVTHTTVFYKIGDGIVNTTIVAVDYRPMPRPDKPFLLSGSRVIVRAENAYWAVDIGQTFSDRYRLNPEQLPASLPAIDRPPVSETPTPAPSSLPSTGG